MTDYEKTAYIDPLRTDVIYNTYYLPNPIVESKTTYLGTHSSGCSCVAKINSYFQTHFKTVDGYARSIPVTSNLPASAGFAVTYDSWMGHLIHYYLDGDYIVVDAEWNYEHFVKGDCPMSSGRKILVGSSIIKGYINP